MKFKIALVAVLVAGLTASLAIAAPAKTSKKPTGTNTTTTTTKKVKKAKKVCRPNVSLILRGTLATIAGDHLSFAMDVKQVNRHAKAYKGERVTVQVNAKTKIRRLGHKVALEMLTLGDRLNVQARVCKIKIKKSTGEAKKWTWSTGEPAPPLAVRVVARPAKAAPTTTTTS